MNILVVGGGGREHAIIQKLRENPEIDTIYALPGSAGMAQEAVCVPIGAKEIEKIVDFAVSRAVDFAVVTPDDPLALGCVDALESHGIPSFGPTQRAAVIESSKVFAKELMAKYQIPTAACRVFSRLDEALSCVAAAPLPVVIKADGLALGKGVVIARTREEAVRAVRAMMEEGVFGESGRRVVIEEFLEGPEVSVLAFTDGKTLVPMLSSMDHKRALDGDTGPNTGGMGAVAPNPYYTEAAAARCWKEIFLPTMEAMNAEGRTFRGCLYFGLMLTKDGPKVIEYNCRFGDPETQAVLPLMKSDLYTVLRAVRDGRLAEIPVEFDSGCACCVVLASRGYPGSYESGCPITYPAGSASVRYFAAGTAEKDGQLVSAGGRVLGVTALAPTLREARDRAYRAVEQVDFAGGFYRRDIGARALEAREAE